MAKKIDLAEEAEIANDVGEDENKAITDELLIDLCPKSIASKLKIKNMKSTTVKGELESYISLTPAQRADLLYSVKNKELKEARDLFNGIDKFLKKLEQWFIQNMEPGQTGVSGKVGRVEVKKKIIAATEDWDKFYSHIKKKGEFDLLNKAINQKAVGARWEAGKEIPGLMRFEKQVISLTGVKK